jgi:CubicO group peptidase (beta-lactamase class C family)
MTSGRSKPAVVINTPLACQPGACFVYSDLGADVLGWVVESVAGLRLDTFLAERVFKPLGMNDTYYNPPDSVRHRIAPTEVAPPRGYPLRGEVHDENAFALGGVAGHAGLFSTAADLAVFAQMMLNGGVYDDVRIFSDSTVSLFTRRTAGTRALGYRRGQGGSGVPHVGRVRPHHWDLIWIDPDRQMFVVLLTNRVHAARARRPSKVIADVRADLADAAALSVEDSDQILNMPASFRADRADGWNKSVRRSRRSSRSSRAKATSSKSGRAVSKARSAKSSKARSSKSGAKRSVKPKVSAKPSARTTRSNSAASKVRPTASASRSGAKASTRSSSSKSRPIAKRTSGSAAGK